MNSEDTYHSVQERYASVARQAGPDNQRSYERKVATAFGYDLEDLRSIPDNANLGVSCGNPLATATVEISRPHGYFTGVTQARAQSVTPGTPCGLCKVLWRRIFDKY